MAEPGQGQEAEGVEASVPSKGRSKLMLILIPTILVLGVGGFLGWSRMKGGEAAAPPDTPVGPPPIVSLKPFVVNLLDDGDYPRFLKVEFDLELRPGSNAQEVEAQDAEVRDIIIVLLSSKRSQDIASIEGKDRLRDEIITRVNSRLRSATANRIFFRQFIIQ